MTAAPRCECGHATGEHRTVVGGFNVTHGVCLTPGCDCKKFREVPKEPKS